MLELINVFYIKFVLKSEFHSNFIIERYMKRIMI